MKKETDLTKGISQPEIVDEYMRKLKHPMVDVIAGLRTFLLSIDKNIGEGIFWNVPTFYFMGKMKAFDPKEYKRYIVGFNYFKQDTVRLIFLKGAHAKDPTGILKGDYKDGRRIVSFKNIEEAKRAEPELKKIVKQLIKLMKWSDSLKKYLISLNLAYSQWTLPNQRP